MTENSRVRNELEQSNQQNQTLTSEKASLSEKVAIAAQLDATNISLTPLSKKGKAEKYMKNAKTLAVSFAITKNVTASNGTRSVYVRVTTPEGEVLNVVLAYEAREIKHLNTTTFYASLVNDSNYFLYFIW